MAPGEYIPRIFHPFIYLIFLPGQKNDKYRRFLRIVLLKIGLFKTFPKRNLDSILQQWFGVLRYKLDTTNSYDVECRILVYSNDYIVRRGSVNKLSKVFPNNIVITCINTYERHISNSNPRILEEFFSTEF